MNHRDILRDTCGLLVVSNNVHSHLVLLKARLVNFLPRGAFLHVRPLPWTMRFHEDVSRGAQGDNDTNRSRNHSAPIGNVETLTGVPS
jgi:hypothetical protein